MTCLLCLYFLILQYFNICVFSFLLLLGGVCNFRLRVRMGNMLCMTLDSQNLVQRKRTTIWALISILKFFRMLQMMKWRWMTFSWMWTLAWKLLETFDLQKNMTKELKNDYFNDDSVIDIAKLFGAPTMSSKFSVYVYLLPFLSKDVRLKNLVSCSTFL